MSATRRAGSQRGGGVSDFFGTPGWCVDRLLESWQPRPGPLVEPGAGRGSIIQAFEAARSWPAHTWHAIECVALFEPDLLAAASHVVVEIGDFLDPNRPVRPSVAAAIGNPPYSSAEPFIRQARRCYPGADLAILLRVNFLASEDRLALWRDVGVPNVLVLPNRPSFGRNRDGKPGSDSTEYAWLVFPPAPRPVGYTKILASTPLAIRSPRGKR